MRNCASWFDAAHRPGMTRLHQPARIRDAAEVVIGIAEQGFSIMVSRLK